MMHLNHRAIAVATIVLVGSITSVPAGELPTYPVEQWCDRVANSSGSRSELIFGGCIQQEQSAYDSLKATWGVLPSQMQSWSDTVAKSGGAGSYLILNGCVQQEQNAGRENSSRQFRR
jgi:hypothetical protein